jgi:hypothetical protein
MDRAGLALLKPVAVAVDGSYPVIQESAYRETPKTGTNNPLPMLGAALVGRSHRARVSIIPRRWAGNINAPERTTVSRMQRPSEPQLIAEGIDNIIPFIRRNFEASDGIDQEEQEVLDELNHYSDRALRHAEIFDLTTSLPRVGMNKRNARRLRELFPELGPGAA